MRKQVAKLVIIDDNGNYLLMYRNNHPTFGNDPDLPGGTLEDGEAPLETVIREVDEEAGFVIDKNIVKEIFSGTKYSQQGTNHVLYVAHVETRPEIVMSWEHAAYEWLARDDFLDKVRNANDHYMHMVYEALK